MKAIISLVLALHGIFSLAGIIYAQSQSTDRAKAHRGREEGRQGNGLRLFQRFGR